MSEQTASAAAPDVRARVLGDLVTDAEIIQAFGWCHGTYYAYCRQGMPYVRLGNKRYHRPAEVREWFISRQADRNPRPVGRPRKAIRK